MSVARLRVALAVEVVVLLVASAGLYHLFGQQPDAGTASSTGVPGLVSDDFDRAGPSLGVAPGGDRWRVVSGRWVIDDGRLTAPDEPPAAGAVALLPMARNGSIRAVIGTNVRGWGLVIRWQGPNAYWRVESVPKAGGYRLVRVHGGTATTMGTTGLAPLAPGSRVELTGRGRTITVVVDGQARLTATDPAPGGDQAGVSVAPDGGAGGAWDEVVAGGPANVVFPPAAGGAGS